MKAASCRARRSSANASAISSARSSATTAARRTHRSSAWPVSTAELAAKQTEFDAETAKIDGLNQTLAKRDLEPLVLLTHEAWQDRQEGSEGSSTMATRASWILLLGL